MMMEIQEEQRQARKKAMKLLECMDRTENGLSDRLLQAGFSEQAVLDAVSYVKSYGYINDSRYALNYITYRIHEKSRQKIFQELYTKGIDRETASEAWEQACSLEEPDERMIPVSYTHLDVYKRQAFIFISVLLQGFTKTRLRQYGGYRIFICRKRTVSSCYGFFLR